MPSKKPPSEKGKVMTGLPKKCCGACEFSHDAQGQTFLLCFASPPAPVPDDIDGGITWERGAAVEPNDPPCKDFLYKMGNA